MNKYSRLAAAGLLLAALLPATLNHRGPRAAAQSKATAEARERAYRTNNVGVALLEQFKPKEAAEEFRRALSLDPGLLLPRINLAVALYNAAEVEAARAEAERAVAVSASAPQPHYILGLIAKQQGRVEDALASFRRVLSADPRDVGANVQLGQLLSQQRKYEEAAAAFRVALEEEPYNGTALYNLGTALLRAGQREAGQEMMQRFQALRQGGAATVIGQNYLEQGRYAEAVVSTGAEADLVDRATPPVRFVDATAPAFPPAAPAPRATGRRRRGPATTTRRQRQQQTPVEVKINCALGCRATPFDFDGDGDLDLLNLGPSGARLYRNDRGRFADVTARSGAVNDYAAEGDTRGAVAGDYDNDGREDLLLVRDAGVVLLHGDGGGVFSHRTASARIPSYQHLAVSAAFLDADHDGDLDIFLAGLAKLPGPSDARAPNAEGLNIPEDFDPAPNVLLRNNGDGTFADVTEQAKVGGPNRAVAVVPTDYDNRRDVDLLVVNYGARPSLFRNLRDGSFRDVAAEVGLDIKGNFTAAAAGDFNKDNFTDFYFAASDGPGRFAASDGRGRFKVTEAPASLARGTAAQFLDYDNDGLLDLLSLTEGGPRVLRNTGAGWSDVTESATRGLAAFKAFSLASADFDGDGDTDLLARGADDSLRLLRNEGGERNRSVSVRLAGKVSNRSGVEAKVELRAGSLQQKLETYAATPAPAPADLVFGLGRREAADAVRVIWPSGVVQAETESPGAQGQQAARITPGPLSVTELDRKPSSCPYLYTWNGERFEFVTDFMGGGETGAWLAPGVYNMPDPDEYVRIRGEQLKERDGRYELRVTNELEEVLFIDRLQLVAVSHPAGVEVYPNEGLGNPTSAQFRLHAARGARPPVSARDEHGHDVLERVRSLDRKYPDDFKLLPVRGYAEEHALTLDLGRTGDRPLLLLTGWTDYAWSSDHVSASQRGLRMSPPSLQVKDRGGKWRTVMESVGFPVGRPQTVTVDLAGKFLSESREVRILTSMRVYWDRVQVAEEAGADEPARVERMEASVASLRDRGFSAEVTPDGREPFSYDYARVSSSSPWKTFTGRYTRFGDVRELLLEVDDMFVVSKPGDEVALSFDASRLAPLPAGWTRTFLLYADGFSKEMDINSASPHELAPLPFHGMKGYPYAPHESYPTSEAHQSYLEKYNTRVVASPLPRLVGAAP